MRKKHNKKLFIIDTNVLLHDYKCIYNFEENNVIIPIVVLEELDKFKRGNDIINFHAREFTRELDKLSWDMLLTANIPLGENLGNLHIETGRDFSEKVNQSFPERTADHRILAIAEYVCNSNKDKTVVLITKDINLRMKAKSLGIMAQDYQNDKVANIDDLYKGIQVLEGVDHQLISKLYEVPEGVSGGDFKLIRV
jgi:PhoH-like ATPase